MVQPRGLHSCPSLSIPSSPYSTHSLTTRVLQSTPQYSPVAALLFRWVPKQPQSWVSTKSFSLLHPNSFCATYCVNFPRSTCCLRLREESFNSVHGPSRLCSYTPSVLWFPSTPTAQMHLADMLHESPCLVLASPHFLYILGFLFQLSAPYSTNL